MLQQTLSLSFPLLSFFFFLLSVATADSNVYVQCSQLNFTSMAPYQSNVNSLFTSLADSASAYNFNKFETSPQSDGVYGLFQCRGDLSSSNCKGCVASALSQLKTTCRMSTSGEIQLEGCFVKYNNTPFFGEQDTIEVYRRCGPSIGYNSDVLNRIDGALAFLASGNGEYFRDGHFGSIQGVAQCVQDLSLSDCQDCLLEASGRLRSVCETSNWGDMYLGKCYIRYAGQGTVNLANNGNSTSDESGGGGWDVKDIINLVLSGSSIGGTGGVTIHFHKKGKKLNKKVDINKKDADETKKVAVLAKTESAAAKKIAENAEDTANRVRDAIDTSGPTLTWLRGQARCGCRVRS